MADAFGNIVNLVPAVLGAGIVLGTLGLIERFEAPRPPSGSYPSGSMNDYKVKSVQDMF